MSPEAKPSEPSIFGRWVKATTIGWLFGFVLVVVLSLAWDLVGGGAQFPVGVGMGAGVGVVQARVIGEWLDPTRRWIWATTVGMGLPFVLWDVGIVAGIGGQLSLPLAVVAGSLLVGVLQGAVLRLRFHRRLGWVLASLAGWGLPAAAIALGDSGLLSAPGSLLSIGGMFFGGAVLGAVTGRPLLTIPKRSAV